MAGTCSGRVSEADNEAALGKFKEEIAKEKDEWQLILNHPPTFHLSYSLHISHFPSFLAFSHRAWWRSSPRPRPRYGERSSCTPSATRHHHQQGEEGPKRHRKRRQSLQSRSRNRSRRQRRRNRVARHAGVRLRLTERNWSSLVGNKVKQLIGTISCGLLSQLHPYIFLLIYSFVKGAGGKFNGRVSVAAVAASLLMSPWASTFASSCCRYVL